jgi:threonine synthase
VFKRTGLVIDTHTAVATAVSERAAAKGRHTVIAATASPFKFSRDVLSGMTGEALDDEFRAIGRIAELSKQPVHRALADLRERPVRHPKVIEKDRMQDALLEIMGTIAK